MAENPVSRIATPTKPAEEAPPLSSQPWLHQHGKEIQAFGTVRQFPLALSYETRMYSCQRQRRSVRNFCKTSPLR